MSVSFFLSRRSCPDAGTAEAGRVARKQSEGPECMTGQSLAIPRQV